MSIRNIFTTSQRLLATTRASAFSSQLAPTQNIRTMASLPKTMKGVIIEKTGGREVLQHRTDLPLPEPKEGEILVKNDFVGVNFIDT